MSIAIPARIAAVVMLSLSFVEPRAESWSVSLPLRSDVFQELSPDRRQLAVASVFGPLVIFDAGTGQILAARKRPTERSYSLAWQADGKGFFYGNPDSKDGKGVVAFDGERPLRQLPGGVHRVAASPNGRWLASIDRDDLRLTSLQTGQLLTWKPTKAAQDGLLPVNGVRSIEWASDDVLVTVQKGQGYRDPYAVARYDLASRKTLPAISLPEHAEGHDWALALDKARQRLWLGTEKGHLLEIDLKAHQIVSDRAYADGPISALALSERGDLAAWVRDKVLVADADSPDEPPRDIAAWDSSRLGRGEPLLTWLGADLLLARREERNHINTWRAERREAVIATLNEAPEALRRTFGKSKQKAEQGDPAAQFEVGSMYFLGRGVERDVPQGVAWWQKAATAGHVWAQYELGREFLTGKGGTPPDNVQAQYWLGKVAEHYRVKAEQGDFFSLVMMAEAHQRGRGAHYDPRLASAYLRAALRSKESPGDNDERLVDDAKRMLREVDSELRPAERERVAAVVAAWKPGLPFPRDMREAICAPSKYQQEKFDRETASREFRDFQQRLRLDVDTLAGINLPLAKGDGDAALAELRKAFGNSVAPGPKGDAILGNMIARGPGGIVSPWGEMMMDVRNRACAVGFGGTFTDEGRKVELWYVDLNPFDQGAMAAFENPQLPPYGSVQRDVFPALVFERDEQNRLKWYAVSREMGTILNEWFRIQLQ